MKRLFPLLVTAAWVAGCSAVADAPAGPQFWGVSYAQRSYAVVDTNEDRVFEGYRRGVLATWYPLGVANDEYPYAVQAYMQRGVRVSMELSGGDYLFKNAISPDPAGSVAFDLEGEAFHKRSGLGGRFTFCTEGIDLEDGAELRNRRYEATVMIQTEGGFRAELGYNRAAQAFYFDEAFYDDGDLIDFWSIHLATSQVFRFPGAQALCYRVLYELGTYDLSDLYGIEPRVSRTSTEVTYYPVKSFGIGLSIAPLFFDNDAGIVATRHRFEVGLKLRGTISEKVDLSLDLTGFANDLQLPGEPHSYSETRLGIGWRF